MASPDTDELATIPVPLPAGAPEAETAPQRRLESAEVAPLDAPEAHTVPQERVKPERIEPAAVAAEDSPEHEPEPEPQPAKQGGRWWRGFTGSLAAGLVVLAIGVLVVGGVSLYTGVPGPGAALLIGHPVVAVLALLAQRVADRRTGVVAVGAALAVVLFTVSALSLFWLT